MADLFCLLCDRLHVSELRLIQDQGFVCLRLDTFFSVNFNKDFSV